MHFNFDLNSKESSHTGSSVISMAGHLMESGLGHSRIIGLV